MSVSLKTSKMAHSINPHAVVQKITLDAGADKFRVPFALSISGPSQSGLLILV